MALVVALFVLAVLLFFIFQKWPPRSSLGPLPPGPLGLPIVGSLLSLDRHEIKTFDAWKRKYGEVVCFQNGFQRILLLNSYKALKDAYLAKGDAFNGRPNAKYLRHLVKHSGIVLNDGPVWHEHRRFLLRVLRDFGFGRTLSEDSITAEWHQLRQRLEGQVGQPLEIRSQLVATVNNVVARLAFGDRSGLEDPEFPELTRKLDILFLGFTFTTLLPVLFPVIMKIKPLLSLVESFTPIMEAIEFAHNFVRRKIREHRAVLEETGRLHMDLSQAKDVCDALLIERAKLEREGETHHSFTEWQIIRDLVELFVAGTDTTATTLNWATFFMCLNPEVQKRVHEEIDTVLGSERCATMKDRVGMPYVCAVVDEVLRCSSIARSGVPRRVMYDTQLYGYAIPKDTVVMANLYSIHHDPEVWERPREFYPEHFLGADGRYQPSDYLNPFSIGKRACLGETLARMEIFLFFVGLMQSFQMELADPDADIESIKLGTRGIVRRPLPHKIILKARG